MGKHTSASGVTYTGEWHDDKVCVCECMAGCRPMLGQN